jgi:hypothetical protein
MSTCKLNLDDEERENGEKAKKSLAMKSSSSSALFSCCTFSSLSSCHGLAYAIELTLISHPSQDSLVRQSLECMLIQFLLGLLKSRTNLTNNPATVIAQIVSALKTLAQNLNHGDQVLHILNSDPIWAEFKDQNHDLFIMDTHKRGMIAGRFALE